MACGGLIAPGTMSATDSPWMVSRRASTAARISSSVPAMSAAAVEQGSTLRGVVQGPGPPLGVRVEQHGDVGVLEPGDPHRADVEPAGGEPVGALPAFEQLGGFQD